MTTEKDGGDSFWNATEEKLNCKQQGFN